MKIAIQLEGWNVLDGVSLQTREMIRYLTKFHDIYLFTWIHPDGEEIDIPQDDDNIHYILIPTIDLKHLMGLFTAGIYNRVSLDSPKIARLLKAINPDIVHVMTPLGGIFHSFVSFAKKMHIPLFMSYRSDVSSYVKFLNTAEIVTSIIGKCVETYLRDCYCQATVIIAPSPHIVRKCIDLFDSNHIQQWMDLDSRQINQLVWIPHAVDTDTFFIAKTEERNQLRLQFCRDYNLDPSRKIVLWVSRVVSEKNPERWQRIMLQALSNNLLIEAVAIGKGPLLTNFQDQNLPYIHWIGEIPHKAVSWWMQIADIFLFPSTVETFGNVTLEALACGCQAIIAQQPGYFLLGNSKRQVSNNVEQYDFGWTVDSDNDTDWYTAFDECYNYPMQHKKKVQTFIRKNFSRQHVYQDYITLYEEMC